MKKIRLLVIASAVTVFFGGNSFAANTYSGQAVEDASKASTHASGSAANAIVGSGQVTSAVSAVPLGASGASGAVSAEIADDLMDAATAPIGTPLDVTDETLTVGPPPDEALKTKTDSDE